MTNEIHSSDPSNQGGYGRSRGSRQERGRREDWPQRKDWRERKEGEYVELRVRFGKEVPKWLGSLAEGLREIQNTSKTMTEMAEELPDKERQGYEEKIKGLEKIIAEQGERFIKENKALAAESGGFKVQIEDLKNEITALKEMISGKAEITKEKEDKELEKKPEEIEKVKEEAKEKKEGTTVEWLIPAEDLKKIKNEILKGIEENNERRKALLKEKRALGREFEKVYWEISDLIQSDPMANVLYRKWYKNLMKGKEEEGEKFFQEGERLPPMAALNQREQELKEEWTKVISEIGALDQENQKLRDALIQIFSQAEIKIKAPEETRGPVKMPTGEKAEEEINKELIEEQLKNRQTQQELANLYLEKFYGEEVERIDIALMSGGGEVIEVELPFAPPKETPPAEEKVEEGGGEVIEFPKPEEPDVPLPKDIEREEKLIETEQRKEIKKFLEILKDPQKIEAGFMGLYEFANNPLYQKELFEELHMALDLLPPHELYRSNIIVLLGELKGLEQELENKSWSHLLSCLGGKNFSEKEKKFITETLYRINKSRFYEEAEDISKRGGRGAREVILHFAEEDENLEKIVQKEDWFPPSIPKTEAEVKEGKIEAEGIEIVGENKEKETQEFVRKIEGPLKDLLNKLNAESRTFVEPKKIEKLIEEKFGKEVSERLSYDEGRLFIELPDKSYLVFLSPMTMWNDMRHNTFFGRDQLEGYIRKHNSFARIKLLGERDLPKKESMSDFEYDYELPKHDIFKEKLFGKDEFIKRIEKGDVSLKG